MRKMTALLLALGALAVAAPGVAATHAVSITGVGFAPNSLSVATGDSVTWTNQDNAVHQVVSQDGGFSSPLLKPSETYTYTFAKAGKFTVVDSQAKNKRMTVTVTGTTPAPTVSLSVSPALVTYGGKVTLSGSLSSQAANEQVTIEEQQCGSSAFSELSTATT